MNNTNEGPKDHRLFHYTPKFEYLKIILRDGIWPRFSEEEFTWLIPTSEQELYFAFPMVSFCDIPVLSAEHHTQKYGGYAIALHKECIQELGLSPVWYINPESRFAALIRSKMQFEGNPRLDIKELKHKELFEFLPLMKVIEGTQPVKDTQGHCHEFMDFSEECEWRYIPESSNDWKSSHQRDFVGDLDHNLTSDAKIKLTAEMIESIFVTSNAELEELKSAYPKFSKFLRVGMSPELGTLRE